MSDVSSYRSPDGSLHRYLGEYNGESVYGYRDENGKLHTNIKPKKPKNKRILYYCEGCGQEYIVSKDYNGFIPKCMNCGSIMKRKE